VSQYSNSLQGAAQATQGLSNASQLLGADFESLSPEQQAAKWAQYQQSVSSTTNGVKQYNDQLQTANASQAKFNDTATQGFRNLGQAVRGFGRNAQEIFAITFRNAQDALIEFVETGKFDFKKFIRGIATDLLRLFTNQLYGQLAQKLFGGAGIGGGGFGGGLFGGGGGLFGGGLFGGLFGGGFGLFASGGYTGDISPNRVAGMVHGGEYVMPAKQTDRYRPILEAMRSGKGLNSIPAQSRVNNQPNVIINNYADPVAIQASQDADGNYEITMRRIAEDVLKTKGPRQTSNNLRRRNSRESKALQESTNIARRR